MSVPPIVRWLSRLYPPSIRRAHGAEILADISEAWWRQADMRSRARLLRHLMADASRSWVRMDAPRRRPGVAALAVVSDIGLAFTLLRSRPAAVLVATLMLVAGIGLATTMFALSDPFLSRPLPYAHAERLAVVEIDPRSTLGGPGVQSDFPLLADWQARTDLFDGLAAYVRHGAVRVRLDDRVVALETIAASANFFQVLGVAAAAPATASSYDDEVWLTPRGAAGPLAGVATTDRTLALQPSGALQVRGVLSASFLVPQSRERAPVDAFVELPPGPIVVVNQSAGGLSARHLTLIARLQGGVAPAQVEAVLNGAPGQSLRVRVVPLAVAMKAQQRPLALGALLAGMLVLVVCAANALGMSLTRGLYRAQQIATMEMLGAGRYRIARMLLAEGGIVTGLGTAGALLLVPLLLDTISAVVPRDFVVLGAPALSWRVAVFAGLAGLFGCVAWWMGSFIAWRRGVRAGWRENASRDGGMVRAVRFSLTAGQVAVTLVLLAGGGLLARSYLNLVGQDTGMSGDTMAMSASYARELTGVALVDTIERTMDELRRLPGVRSVAAGVGQMVDQFNVTGIVMIGRPWPVERLWVSPDYFEASGMTFVEGRPSRAGDDVRGVVVNEALVERLFDGRTTIGDMLRVGGSSMPIVGIVKDARRRALDEPSAPAVFLPLEDSITGMRVTYLVSGANVNASVWESTIRRVSPDAVILDGGTIRERLARTIRDRSFAALVVGLFAVATIGVTVAGLIGVVGYVAARRTREMGIRMALGAQPRNVIWLVMRDAFSATIIGIAAGLAGAVWMSDSMTSLVYGVSPRDGLTLAATTALVMAFAVVAAVIPARRAGQLSPTVALREE